MKLITYKKAAEYLDLPVGTLYAWVHEKKIPHVRLGKRTVRFDQDELARWVAAGRQPVR